MPGIVQHGFEVIDDAPTGTHAIARDDNGRARGLGKVVDYGNMVGVAVDLDQIVECQRVAAAFDALAGFLIPVWLQASIGCGEA